MSRFCRTCHLTGGSGSGSSASGGVTVVHIPPAVEKAGAAPAGSLVPEIEHYLGRNSGPYPAIINRPTGSVANRTINLPPIPIEWIVSPSPESITSSKQCPTANGTIHAFVAADLILALVLLITAFRPFLYRTTLHVFGKRNSHGVYWTWIFWFVLQVLGNVGASLVVVNTPGYEHLEFATIFALYASRPRLKAWWLSLLRTLITVNGHRFPDGNERLVRENAERSDHATRQPPDTAPEAAEITKQEYASPHDSSWAKYEEVEHPYTDSYISAVVVEILFQIVAAVFIGVTWRRFPNMPIKEFMQPSLNYMFVAPALTFLAAVAGVPIWRLSGEAWGSREKEDKDPATGKLLRRWSPKGIKAARVKYALWGSVFFIPAYVAAWVYWTRFLVLPGALWCPPGLVSQTAIWIFTGMF